MQVYFLIPAVFLLAAAMASSATRLGPAVGGPPDSCAGPGAPRAGGMAIAMGLMAASGVLFAMEQLEANVLVALIPSGLAVALAGCQNDRRCLPRWLVPGILAVAAVWGVAWLWIVPEYAGIPPLQLGAMKWAWGWFGFAVFASAAFLLARGLEFAIVSRGTLAVQTALISLAAALIARLGGAFCHAWLLTALAAAALGFLVYNRSPGRIVPGTGGVHFLGLTFVLLAALTAPTVGTWPWVVLLAPLVVQAAASRLGFWNHGAAGGGLKKLSANFIVYFSVLIPLAIWSHTQPQWGWLAALMALGTSLGVDMGLAPKAPGHEQGHALKS